VVDFPHLKVGKLFLAKDAKGAKQAERTLKLKNITQDAGRN
jgi:hypothetical protein